MDIDYKKTGELIRSWRKKRGYYQEGLASEIKVSPTYLSEIENGKKQVSLKVLADISRALGVTMDDLIDYNADNYNDDESINTYIYILSIVMKDCNDIERKILCDNMKSLKIILRDNR